MDAPQEREAKKDTWKPRWFRATPGAPVFDGEHPEDACPLWEFTGDAFQQPKRPALPEGSPHSTPAFRSIHRHAESGPQRLCKFGIRLLFAAHTTGADSVCRW